MERAGGRREREMERREGGRGSGTESKVEGGRDSVRGESRKNSNK